MSNSPIQVEAEIHLSDRLYDLITQKRVWNRFEKESLHEELEKHHQERIPERFRQDARDKHEHAPRNPGYLAYKNRVYHSRRDLVKKGITETRITSVHQITIEGSATGSKYRGPGLTGHLRMQFPFPGTRDTLPGHVTIEQMRREILHTTEQEQTEISMGFGHRCSTKLNTYLSGRRRFYKSS